MYIQITVPSHLKYFGQEAVEKLTKLLQMQDPVWRVQRTRQYQKNIRQGVIETLLNARMENLWKYNQNFLYPTEEEREFFRKKWAEEEVLVEFVEKPTIKLPKEGQFLIDVLKAKAYTAPA